MYSIDPRIRGIPAQREQIVALFESVNQPHLAIPGKQAGPARAFIVGLRGAQGLNMFIYLHLPDAGDCAVYLSPRRNVQAAEYANEEAEALAFVESMGFIVENANFTQQPQAKQEELMKMLPVFQREPKPAAGTGKQSDGTPLANLGRLLGSF